MSSICSQASADFLSGSSEPECIPSHSQSLTLTASRYSERIGRVCQCSGTFAASAPTKATQMLSAEAFLARTSVLQVVERGSQEFVLVSGASIGASSMKSNRGGQSSRTSASFALVDWKRCSGNLLRSGMTRNGTVFPLPPLALITRGIASGLLPTPSASSYGSNQGGGAGRVGKVRHSLQSMAKRGLWPTPTANRRSGLQSHGVNFVLGTLNPMWVAWFMGFPMNWLGTNFELLATPSSRKSHTSSAAQSCARAE